MAASDIVDTKKEQPMADEAINTVKGKRKAETEAEICPTKKARTINDGFCAFIGNLNKTKNHDEIKLSLANFLTTEGLLVQDIRLHSNRTFAYVDMATDVDLTKALTLNGKRVLDLPLRISKAKVKEIKEEKKKKKLKPTPEQKAEKFSKWLSVTNLPHKATRAEILGIFNTAVDVKFPGETPKSSKGMAIVHFDTKELAEKALKKKRGKKLREMVIQINAYRPKSEACVNDENTQAVAQRSGPTNTLLIKNLPRMENEVKLKKIFKTAVGINVPKDGNSARGFAFVEFKTAQDATDAMEMAQGMKILKKAITVEFSKTVFRQELSEALLTTLMVSGLSDKTSEETLSTAFEGCTTTRIIRDKKTSRSKGFGFVEFAEKDACQAAKESMEDCEIDGKKVTVAFAKSQITQSKPGKQPSPGGQAGDKPGSQAETKPGVQPGPKDQPSATKAAATSPAKPSQSKKRKMNKKKGQKLAAQVEAKEEETKDEDVNGAVDAEKDAEVKE